MTIICCHLTLVVTNDKMLSPKQEGAFYYFSWCFYECDFG